MRHCDHSRGPHPYGKGMGFTLIELLLVITIIGVMSALIITAVSNAAIDTRTVVARQQQITLQDALNAWVAANSTGTNTLQSARVTYAAASTALNKLALISNYLHPETYSHFVSYSSSSQIKSEAMTKAGIYLQFSSWAATNYPIVNWYTN